MCTRAFPVLRQCEMLRFFGVQFLKVDQVYGLRLGKDSTVLYCCIIHTHLIKTSKTMLVTTQRYFNDNHKLLRYARNIENRRNNFKINLVILNLYKGWKIKQYHESFQRVLSLKI